MFLTDTNANNLQITVDNAKIISHVPYLCVENGDTIFCSCKTEYCQCGSNLEVTETAAKQIYTHMGFVDGRSTMTAEGYRMDTVHVWGTHNLSTSDLLRWLKRFDPKGVEWIDDSSCNIPLSNENMVLRLLTKLTEPFDRRVALAAMAAIVSTMGPSHSRSDTDDVANESDAVPSIPSADNLLPPSGRWFKTVSSPEGSFCLYIRIAHRGDIKLPGAERRSDYYRRHGNPNYGGAVGLLSRSYRRRAKNVVPSADVRSVSIPLTTQTRNLVNYSDMDEDIHGITRHLATRDLIASDDDDEADGSPPSSRLLPSGRRREAVASGLDQPPRTHPPKWPRREVSAVSETVFRPPPPLPQSALSFDFGGNIAPRVSVKRRLGPRQGQHHSHQPPALTTVTILPDVIGDEEFQSTQMLTSLRMVADIEEEAHLRHQLRLEENIFNRRGPPARQMGQLGGRRRLGNQTPGGRRDVWNRLG